MNNVTPLRAKLDAISGASKPDAMEVHTKLIDALRADIAGHGTMLLRLQTTLEETALQNNHLQLQYERERELHQQTLSRLSASEASVAQAMEQAAAVRADLLQMITVAESEKAARVRAEEALDAERAATDRRIASVTKTLKGAAPVAPANSIAPALPQYQVRITGRDLNGDATTFDVKTV